MASSTGVTHPSSPNAPALGGGDVLQQPAEVGNSDPRGNATPMNPLLLASVCVGSSAALNFLFHREDKQEPPMMMPTQVFLDKLAGYTPRSSTGRPRTVPQDDFLLPAPPAAALHDAVEDGVHQPALPPRAQLLEGITAEGDTALHAVATNGDSKEFLDCASIINTRDTCLLFVVNRKGDTPLHCAARSGNSQMLSLLIVMARRCNRMHEFMRKENMFKETALHDAVRIGSRDIVTSLLHADPLLAIYPEQGTSPLYLSILQRNETITQMLFCMSNGNLSYDGPHGKNALHAAIYHGLDITESMLNWNNSLTAHGDREGCTPLQWASSFNYSPLYMRLLEANPAAVFQADNKGWFPIHVAAFQGLKDNICIILDKYPSSAGLRTAQGRTFLHVAVAKERLDIVSFVCRTVSLAWILNMQDNEGYTALHLAVQAGRLRIFCSLYRNEKVLLSLPNNKDETPANLSYGLIPLGMGFEWNNDLQIYRALAFFGHNLSCRRWDQFADKCSYEVEPAEKVKEEEKVKDSSQILIIGSVLIATVTFGATFAVPGGFIADDHTNRGTPTLAGRYTFDAFA